MLQHSSPATLDLSQRRICVVDPALALSRYGVPLVKQLREAMELWIARELWHILSNPSIYLNAPELILPLATGRSRGEERLALEEITQALHEWESICSETDLMALRLFWLGDNLRESCLPNRQHWKIFRRWESLARSLHQQLDRHQDTNQLLTPAFRDTIALTMCLESAFILTYQSASNELPDICYLLRDWGIFCQKLAPEDEVASMERNYFRQVLIHLGLTKILWSNLQLVILHLLAPTTLETPNLLERSSISAIDEAESPEFLASRNLWSGLAGFWYQI